MAITIIAHILHLGERFQRQSEPDCSTFMLPTPYLVSQPAQLLSENPAYGPKGGVLLFREVASELAPHALDVLSSHNAEIPTVETVRRVAEHEEFAVAENGASVPCWKRVSVSILSQPHEP